MTVFCTTRKKPQLVTIDTPAVCVVCKCVAISKHPYELTFGDKKLLAGIRVQADV